MIRLIPVGSSLVVYEPGWVTTYGISNWSARRSSSMNASIDFFQSESSGLARFIRYESWMIGCEISCFTNAALNFSAASPVIGLARHWLLDLEKIWRQSQPTAAARSTARSWPPAIDIWAPRIDIGLNFPLYINRFFYFPTLPAPAQ